MWRERKGCCRSDLFSRCTRARLFIRSQPQNPSQGNRHGPWVSFEWKRGKVRQRKKEVESAGSEQGSKQLLKDFSAWICDKSALRQRDVFSDHLLSLWARASHLSKFWLHCIEAQGSNVRSSIKPKLYSKSRIFIISISNLNKIKLKAWNLICVSFLHHIFKLILLNFAIGELDMYTLKTHKISSWFFRRPNKKYSTLLNKIQKEESNKEII